MATSYDDLKNKILSRYGHIDSIPDSVYSAMKQYQQTGDAALDDDRIYNILVAEKNYSGVPAESPSEMRERAKKEYASDVLQQKLQEAASIKENNPLLSKLFPHLTEQVQRETIKPNTDQFDALKRNWAGIKDISSSVGRGISERMAGGPKEEIDAVREEHPVWSALYDISRDIAEDPLLPGYAAIGALGGPIGASGIKEIAKGLGRVTLATALPLIDKPLQDEKNTGVDWIVSGLGAVIPEALSYPLIRSGIKQAQIGLLGDDLAKFQAGLERSRAIQAQKQKEADALADLTTEGSETIRLPSVTYKQNKIQELEKKIADLETQKKTGVNLPDVFLTAGTTSVAGPFAGVAAPYAGRVVKRVASGLADMKKPLNVAMRTEIQGVSDKVKKGQMSQQDANAVIRAAEALRFNPSDADAAKIISDYKKQSGI